MVVILWAVGFIGKLDRPLETVLFAHLSPSALEMLSQMVPAADKVGRLVFDERTAQVRETLSPPNKRL
jgi:hypothetical protein